MKSLTIGILTYTLDQTLRQFTKTAIAGFAPFADELIVVENGGEDAWDADLFIHYKQNQGYTKGVNTILKNASSDFVLFVSNDIALNGGDPHDLCVENTVTSPIILPTTEAGFSGAMFCLPKKLLEQTGYFDERMVLRYSDTAFSDHLVKLGIPIQIIKTLSVSHEPDHTIHRTIEMAEGDEGVYYSL